MSSTQICFCASVSQVKGWMGTSCNENCLLHDERIFRSQYLRTNIQTVRTGVKCCRNRMEPEFPLTFSLHLVQISCLVLCNRYNSQCTRSKSLSHLLIWDHYMRLVRIESYCMDERRNFFTPLSYCTTCHQIIIK